MAKNKSSQKKLIIVMVAVLLLASVAVTFRLIRDHRNQSKAPVSTVGSTNLTPPTEAEKQETEQHKQEISSQTPAKLSTGTDGRKQVTPVISSADKATVSAYVTGIFEEGGTCTATLTSGSKTITKTSTGFQNASYTQCAPIDLSGSNLGSDTWSVTVSYSSTTAAGKSGSSIIKP